MTNKRYYSVKPGEFILNSNEPLAVEYRNELLSYLDEYPDGNDKNDVKGRLWSYTESGFHSACFELFLHHLLITRCQEVTLHPVLPSVATHPDFGVKHVLGNFFLEATLALESEEYQAQEQRLQELVDAVREVRGSVILWAQPVTHLPDNFPLDCVRDFLCYELDRLDPAELQLPQTLRFEDIFNNLRVIIDFEVMGADQDSCDSVVQAWGSLEAREVTTHKRIRRRVGFKGTQYGQMGKPYIVAVWPKCQFPLTEEAALRALYGDPQYIIDLKTHQTIAKKRVSNGVFNTVIKGNVLNRQVSAAALYREQFLEASYKHQLYIYHNPCALSPIPEEIFSGLPQFVFRQHQDKNGHALWLNGINPWDG